MSDKKEFNKKYEKMLDEFQVELVRLQDWVIDRGKKIAIIFEGRDAAGKGGTIKRIRENLNPRYCKVVALAAPTEREKTMRLKFTMLYIALIVAVNYAFTQVPPIASRPSRMT